jgi:hypothetical protein
VVHALIPHIKLSLESSLLSSFHAYVFKYHTSDLSALYMTSLSLTNSTNFTKNLILSQCLHRTIGSVQDSGFVKYFVASYDFWARSC